jgi:hypothetical protein
MLLISTPELAMVVLDILPVSEWVHIIRAEYLEMPGLALTRRQMERLWGLDGGTCDEALTDLLAHGFLVCHPDGNYARPRDEF